MQDFCDIPTIDLKPMFDEGEEGLYLVAQMLQKVYCEVGFGYIINHQIPQVLIDKAFAQARMFHALPLEEKMKIKQGKSFRGYMPRHGSTLKSSGLEAAKKPNESEAFIMLHDMVEEANDYGGSLSGPNLWPDESILPDFKRDVQAYFDAQFNLARKMLRVFSLAFGLKLCDLDHYFDQPTLCLRLQYYPPQPEVISENQFGIAPHTDYGFFTILAQDTVAGLQVKNRSEEWIDVPPVPGSFVLNTSDMLKLMTNNHFLSTRHRVINHSGQARYSMPFFFEPNMRTRITPLPFFCKDSKQTEESVVYGDYVLSKVNSNYGIKS